MLFYHLCLPAAKYRTVVVQMLCKNEMKWKFGYACRQFSSTSASHICNKLPDCSKLVCGGLSNHAIFTCSNHSKKARLRTGRVPFGIWPVHSHSDTLRPEWILSIFPQAETVCSKEVPPAMLIWTVCVNQVCVTIVLINSWELCRLTINTQNSRLLLVLGNINTTTCTTNWKSVMTTVLVLLVSSTQAYINHLWPFIQCHECASVTLTSLR